MSRKYQKKNKYTIINFAVDVVMTGLTFGLWLIWIFAREMRNR